MTSEPVFTLLEESREGQTVIRLSGELDLVSAPQLTEAMHAPLAAGRPFVIDLTEVTFIDSSGLAAIVTTARDAAARALIGLAPSRHAQPNRLLEITGIADLLAPEPDGAHSE